MGSFAGLFIAACWASFLTFWLIAALSTKRTVERQSGWWRMVPLLAAVAVMLVQRSGGPLAQLVGASLWQDTLPVGILADVLSAVGLAIMLWARVTLGGNWSGNVVLKENHELIERGPYRFVRHPIYSGLLLMYFGTAIYFARVGTLIALVAVVAGLLVKARQEERLLTRHFPQAYTSYKARVPALIPFML